jgi:hypothetical protein
LLCVPTTNKDASFFWLKKDRDWVPDGSNGWIGFFLLKLIEFGDFNAYWGWAVDQV